MNKLILLSAVALLTPATVQAKPKPADPVAAAPATEPAAEAAPAASAAAPAPVDQKAAIADRIKTDWPKYDAGAKGYLTRDELAKWLTDLRVAANQPAPDAEWQKGAFVQTDTNNDARISSAELTKFLTGGA